MKRGLFIILLLTVGIIGACSSNSEMRSRDNTDTSKEGYGAVVPGTGGGTQDLGDQPGSLAPDGGTVR
jgi:hypothetical protein